MRSPFRPDVLADKRILVSGGGSGLGKEIARGFAAHGATVYICGRREGVLAEAAAELGPNVVPLGCNLRDPDSIAQMAERIWQDGPLTGLINNAAANFIAPTKDLTPRGYEAIRSTVMDGNFYATLEVGKRWIAGGNQIGEIAAASLGYFSSLLGPPLIGFLAESVGLLGALWSIALLFLAAFAGAIVLGPVARTAEVVADTTRT